ncbi:hypothetical protein [Streptomyces sp. NPDC048442]|uniref:hypothetical protein n=1 Tax=Streptomyces sp. NPDC048442 TaxID=3154823 RepID=UPI00341AE538
MDIVEFHAPGDYAQREAGLYLSARHGRITYSEGGGTCQATGTTMWLMDGTTRLARYELIVASRVDAGEHWEKQRDRIAPWAKVLRTLRPIPSLRHRAQDVVRAQDLMVSAGPLWPEDHIPAIAGHATEEDLHAVKSGVPETVGEWAAVAQHIVTRLTRDITDRQRIALTLAPPLATHGNALHGWETVGAVAGDTTPVAPTVAAELLAGWAAFDQQRDTLVRWAVDAGVAKTRAHALTRLSRSTIDRLLHP